MNSYSIQIMDYLKTQSWQIAILVILIAAASWLLRNRSAHVRYLLWLVVLAKCLVPPLLMVPLPILPEQRAMITFAPTEPITVEPVEASAAEAPTQPVPAIVKHRPGFTTHQWLVAAWIVGVSMFVLVAVVKALRTELWLRRERKCLPAGLQKEIEELLASFGIRISPKLWLVEGIGQPFVWGLVRGGIYLPANFVKANSAEHRKGVIGHELSHVLRYDAAVNLLQVIAQALFWFHPFVWWANKRIRAEREKCCDEMTIARLGAAVKDYSAAIVNVLITEHESTRRVPSLAVAGPVKNIEERIKTMLKPGKKFYKRPSLIAASTVLLAAFLTVPTALVLTARAAEKVRTDSGIEPTKSLHEAAATGDLEQVRLHISDGADVNGKDQRGRTALHRAANTGHAEVARLLIENGADVNIGDNLNRTPLEHAAVAGHAQVAELLIDRGANPNARNRDGLTPLHVAAGSADKDTVRLLIDKGGDVTLRDAEGSTPLHTAMMSSSLGRREIVDLIMATGKVPSTIHLAAYMGDLAKVRTFVEEGVSVNQKEADGGTALHYAAAGGQKDVVRLLLARGADVSIKATDGMTPLHAAVFCSDDVETVKLLIDNGADVNAHASVEDETGMSVLGLRFARCAMQSAELADAEEKRDVMTSRVKSLWNSEITRLLMSRGAMLGDGDRMWLSIAAAMDMPDIIELAIAQSEDVNAKLPEGSTLLHHAARLGHRKLVEQLLAKGADITMKDRNGKTPLSLAEARGHTEIVQLLKKHEAPKDSTPDPDEPGAAKSLHEAAQSGDLAQVQKLIAQGADVNAEDQSGETPLHKAAREGHKEIAELLIAKGAEVDAKKPGWTPLTCAVWADHTDVIRVLVTQGADVNYKPTGTRTTDDIAFFYCVWNKDKMKLAELFVTHGARLDMKDNSGRTVLDLSVDQAHQGLVGYFISKGSKAPAFHLAAFQGDLTRVKSLLDEGTNVDTEDQLGRTPLYWACSAGHEGAGEYLLSRGARADAKAKDGSTPLHQAARSGAFRLAELLVAKGADVNARAAGRTPLSSATAAGHSKVAELLITKGANVSEKGLIYQAVIGGHTDMVRLLVAHGVDVNVRERSRRNQTPLDIAKRRGLTEIAEILREHGAKE